jgi:hypothetical protein
VEYTVEDTAGNVKAATRYVKVIDKNIPVITIDGQLTEYNGTTSIKAGTHNLVVDGLRDAGEPYKIQLVRGIYSTGQMKRVFRGTGIAVDSSGDFTLEGSGYYTLYITTQSRQTYRTLLYVAK